MKQKNLAMLGVAVGCGLVAAVAVAKLSAGGGKGPDTVKVLVAKKDIPLQTKLEEKELDNLLVWADVPKSIAPPDAATDLEQVKGKSLNRTLKQGNPVSLTDVGNPQNIVLPEGAKAITVKATQVDAVGGFVKPGAIVDVMYVERMNSGKARAAIILRDMLVLAVNMVHTLDEKTGAAIAQVESVSLAVNDKQAARLALGDEKGKLKLMLKGTSKSEVKKDGNDDIEWIEDPFDPSTKPAPVVSVPTPTPTPAQKFEKFVQAKKSVPLNTLINADNVDEYFTTLEVKFAPQGVVTNADDLKGKYIVKPVEAGQTLYKSLTDNKPVEVVVVKNPDPKGPPTVSVPVVPEKKRYPRFEQVFQAGGRAHRVVWLEVAPNKWKRFESEKEADEYQPEPDAPKGTKPKEADPKASAGQ